MTLDDTTRRLLANPDAPAAHLALTPELVGWLAAGQRGVSSGAIVHHLVGWHTNRHHEPENAAPRDRGDLGRCVTLLDQVPQLRAHLPHMATVSTRWAALVEHWDELERCAKSNLPADKKRLETFMRELNSPGGLP